MLRARKVIDRWAAVDMLLTITTTSQPATLLCDLLRVDPDDVRTRRFDFGEALVFAPQFTEQRCAIAVMLEGSSGRPHPTTAAMAKVLSAMFERARQDMSAGPLQLHVDIPNLTCPGGASRVHQLFGPLGYSVRVGATWGDDVGVVTLSRCAPLATLLEDLRAFLPRLAFERAEHGAA